MLHRAAGTITRNGFSAIVADEHHPCSSAEIGRCPSGVRSRKRELFCFHTLLRQCEVEIFHVLELALGRLNSSSLLYIGSIDRRYRRNHTVTALRRSGRM